MGEKKALTKKQSDALFYVKSYIKDKGYPPTLMEICEEFNIKSTNYAWELIRVLEKKGYLEKRERGSSRAIKLKESAEAEAVPTQKPDYEVVNVLGGGSALDLDAFFLSSRGSVLIDSNFFQTKNENLFAILVGDEAMKKEGVSESDLAIISKREPKENEITAVLLHDSILLRKISYVQGGFELISKVRGYPKIKVEKGDETCAILGSLKGVLKKF